MSAPRIRLTEHAMERGRQRLHLKPKWLAAKAAQVFQTGQRLDRYDGLLRYYRDRTHLQHRASDLRVFGRELWVFRYDGATVVLVNVATVPRPLLARLARLAQTATGSP